MTDDGARQDVHRPGLHATETIEQEAKRTRDEKRPAYTIDVGSPHEHPELEPELLPELFTTHSHLLHAYQSRRGFAARSHPTHRPNNRSDSSDSITQSNERWSDVITVPADRPDTAGYGGIRCQRHRRRGARRHVRLPTMSVCRACSFANMFVCQHARLSSGRVVGVGIPGPPTDTCIRCRPNT